MQFVVEFEKQEIELAIRKLNEVKLRGAESVAFANVFLKMQRPMEKGQYIAQAKTVKMSQEELQETVSKGTLVDAKTGKPVEAKKK